LMKKSRPSAMVMQNETRRTDVTGDCTGPDRDHAQGNGSE